MRRGLAGKTGASLPAAVSVEHQATEGGPVARLLGAGLSSGRASLRDRYGAPMRRAPLWAALLAGAALGVAAHPAAALTGEPACRADEVRQHDEAVFGHFATLAAAKELKAKAAALGFQGIKIENEGCGDFEVEIDGADRAADRTSFAAEARTAGFDVTFEQTAPPMEFRQGQVVGVFAAKRALAQANTLMWRLSAQGFVYVDLVRTPSRWLVVMPQVPVKHALSIAREVSSAGFRITFRPGAQ